MRNLLLIFLVLLSTSLSAVEYGYITNATGEGLTDRVVLNSGDVLDILGFNINDGNYRSLIVGTLDADIDTLQNGNQILVNEGFASVIQSELKSIAGPVKVRVRSDSTGRRATMFYKLTRAGEIEYKNVNIISLPSSSVGQGTHNIVVEASDDLQSWTPVHSSSIGGDKAFFRTRVVEAE